MLGNGPIQHYCDETPDILRNPFQHITRIDYDKLFMTDKVQYDTRLRTTTLIYLWKIINGIRFLS